MREQIRTAIKNGSLCHKVLNKIHHIFPLYYVGNPNIEFQLHTSKTYNKFLKKYRGIIEEGITERKKSCYCNIVWICWLQGEEKMPPLVKACVSSIKKNLRNKEIIILTNKNIEEYAIFPDYIFTKWKSGKIPVAHFSDLLRIELLCTYGGIWLDATVFCITDKIPDYILQAPLFMYKEVGAINIPKKPTVSSSWLISAYSNNNILLLTRKLLWKYWSENFFLKDYFLFHIFLSMAARRYCDEWNAVPTIDNQGPHIMETELTDPYTEERWQQLTQIACFHKLKHHFDYSRGESTIYKHIIEISKI